MAVHSQGALLADRYRVVEPLGSGGMAAVFLCEDERLGRRVAVKRLHSHSPEDVAYRFAREARLGASLNHPNLVAVFDTITDDEGVLIVMEYVQGETLAAALKRGPLGPRRSVSVISGAAAALDHAHGHGVVHRDVKPGNLLLRRDGITKLVDLGIATAADQTRITHSGTVLGTAAYMAPEQLDGTEVTAATDIYALAAVAFEALSGQRARQGRTPMEIAHRVATEPPPDLSEAWPRAPRAAVEALKRGMAADPSRRPARAGDLAHELRVALEQPESGKGGRIRGRRRGGAVAAPVDARPADAAPAGFAPGAAADPPDRAADAPAAASAAPSPAAPARPRPPLKATGKAARPGSLAAPRKPKRERAHKPGGRALVAAVALLLVAAAVAVGAILSGGGDDDGGSGDGQRAAERPNSAAGKTGANGDGADSGRDVPDLPKDLAKEPQSGKSGKSDEPKASEQPGAQAPSTAPSQPASPTPAAPRAGGTVDVAAGRRLNDQGFALFQRGDYATAVPILQRSVASFPSESKDINYAYALYNLGAALHRSGRSREAIPYLEKRLSWPNQTDTVRRELEAAKRAAGN